MASLFALGVMSVVWMAVVAGLIAFEKLIPSRRVATYGTAAVLLVLGVLMLAAPDVIPGLTVPGAGSMPQMDQMGLAAWDRPPWV
jgi:cytochrome c biogenesis protein CcdA